MKVEDYDRHDALGLADLVRRGEVSAIAQDPIRLLHRVLAPPMIWMIRRRVRREAFEWTGYTQLENVTGAPAMSVPLHWAPDDAPLASR